MPCNVCILSAATRQFVWWELWKDFAPAGTKLLVMINVKYFLSGEETANFVAKQMILSSAGGILWTDLQSVKFYWLIPETNWKSKGEKNPHLASPCSTFLWECEHFSPLPRGQDWQFLPATSGNTEHLNDRLESLKGSDTHHRFTVPPNLFVTCNAACHAPP